MDMRRILLSIGFLVILLPAAGFGAAGPSAVADAVMDRDLAGLQALIRQKADVNAPQADGSTALHWAAHWDSLEAADLLIRAGANPKASTRFGATPLAIACENANPAMILKLLAAGADPNAESLVNGETPLMVAARSGQTESVRILLDAGANMEAKDTVRETTALIWAAEQNHSGVVALLLARGANARAGSKVVIPPVRGRAATADDDDDAPPPLPPEANARGGMTALIVAVREGGIETVKALLDGGAPIDQPYGDGSTPLLLALQNGNAEMARLLIERGADVKRANGKGWNPLYLAVKARTMERGTMPNPVVDTGAMLDVIRLLVEKGANVNARLRANTEVHNSIQATWLREPGATPLLRAALCGDLEVMKLLLAHGADPKINTDDGTTPLMALAGVGYSEGFMHDFGGPEQSLEAMKLLIDVGIEVNAVNSDNVMAVHGAAHKNFVQGIQMLVDHGADLAARSHRVSQFERKGSPGNTALDWATGVSVASQSSIYHAEAVELVKKLMIERNIPIEGLSNTKGGLVTPR